MPYYVAGKATWGGSWAATPSQALNASTPATAKQMAAWMSSGSLTDPSRHIQFNGLYPLTLADAADWSAASMPADTAVLDTTGTVNAPTTGAWGRNILFGDDSDNTSGSATTAADGFTFEAVGQNGAGYNIDMRGGTTGSDRQMAALFIQGYDFTVTGFRIRCADRNPYLTGGVAAQLGSGQYTDYSLDNGGLKVRGGWGCRVTNNYVHGGDLSSHGMCVEFRTHGSTFTYNQNKMLEVDNNTVTSCGSEGIIVKPGAGMDGTVRKLPYGAIVLVHHNTCSDAHWGTGGIEAAKYHSNLLSVYGNAINGSAILVYSNTLYGNCEDAIASLGANIDIFSNTILYTCLGDTWGGTVTGFYGIESGAPGHSTLAGYASGWDIRTHGTQGQGIKTGLGDGDWGTAGTGWLVRGTDAANYALDEQRSKVYRNIIMDTSGDGAITMNAASGTLAWANEIVTTRGTGITGGAARSQNGNMHVSHNYVEAIRALDLRNYYTVWAFNNIFVGSSYAAYKSGANCFVYGSTNLLSGAKFGTFDWQDERSGTPAYTVGVGPTAGGNCDAQGLWGAVMHARCTAALRDINNRRWGANRLPLGPRQP
jgi:hypothetical protein